MIDKFLIMYLKVISNPVYAQEPPKLNQLATGFDDLIEYVMPIGAVIAVGMFVYGGYMWISSGGDPARVQQAQGVLTWAVIGLVFLFLLRAALLALLKFIT